MKKLASKLNSKGFSLMEIVLVMAVLTILMGIMVPGMSAYYRNGQEIERRNHEGLVRKAIRQYYAYEGHYPDPAPEEAAPVSGALSDEQEEKLRALLRSVTTVKIDTEKYDFIYNQTTGECTLIIS